MDSASVRALFARAKHNGPPSGTAMPAMKAKKIEEEEETRLQANPFRVRMVLFSKVGHKFITQP